MKYRTIVADPPWEYPEGFATRSRTPGKWTGPVRRYDLPYPSMTFEAICALPVADLAERDARIFLWATNRWLDDAFDVLRAWRFKYRQTLTWKKLDGLSGSVAPNSEFLLVATRGAPGVVSRLPNAVIERSQTKTHSRKPDRLHRPRGAGVTGPVLGDVLAPSEARLGHVGQRIPWARRDERLSPSEPAATIPTSGANSCPYQRSAGVTRRKKLRASYRIFQPPPGGFLVQGDLMLRLIGLLSFALLAAGLAAGMNDGGYW